MFSLEIFYPPSFEPDYSEPFLIILSHQNRPQFYQAAQIPAEMDLLRQPLAMSHGKL